MANTLAVQLVITGETGNLQANLKRIQDQLAQINGGGGGIGGGFSQGAKDAETFQQSLRGLIGRFSALWAVMKSGEGIASVFNTGVKFNAAMEDARLGIGALITAQGKLYSANGQQLEGQTALNAAMYMGNEQIQKLRISGLQTAATTEQLVSAYQDAVGGGLRAGMSLDQIRRLTVQTVQAAGAMGVPMNQLNQEIRSILDGTIDRNSRVAIRLGITNADVEKWKQAGTLFSELNKRMAAFSEAGKESMNNWTTLLSNIAEASQILLGDAFRTPMKNIQGALDAVMKTIVDINTAQVSDKVAPLVSMLKDIGNVFGDLTVATIRAVSNTLMNMGLWWEKNRDALTEVIASFKVFMGDAMSFIGGVAVGFIRFLADSFLWFTKLPEWIKAVNIAIVAFTVAILAANSAIATTAVTSLTSLATKLANIGQLFTYATSFGMSGFTYALGTMVNPVTLLIAGIAALGAGVYYLATASSRAAQAAFEMKRQYVENIQAFNQLLPTLKDVDARMKEKIDPKDTEALKARNELRIQGIKDLIKYAPEQEAFIKKEIEKGTELAKIWLEVAKAKQASLDKDIAAQKMKVAQAQVAAVKSQVGATTSAGMTAVVPGAGAVVDLFAKAKRDAYETELKTLALMEDALDKEKKVVALETLAATVKANVVPDTKLALELERRRHEIKVIDFQIEGMMIDSMPKRTTEEKKVYELRKAGLALDIEMERIEHSKEAFSVKERQREAARLAYGQKLDQVEENYQTRRALAEEKWQEFTKTQEGDTLARKIANLQRLVNAQVRAYEEATGKQISEEEKAAILSERIQRETVAFREQEVKKLESALIDLAKVKGRALTFDEEKAALDGLAEKLNISSAAVEKLKLKIDETQQNRSDWFGGFKAGLQDVADTVINKFELMRSTVKSVADGMKQAFASAISGMLNGTMTLSQGLKSLWKGIVNTIIQALSEIIAKFIVAGIANMVLGSIMESTSQTTALAQYQLAVMESWAAYAGIPYVGWALAMAQIAMITATYVATMGMSAAGGSNSGPSGGGEAVQSTGMNYPGYAEGGLVTRPGFVAEIPGNPELVAPEKSFLDWIKNVANPMLQVPSGGFSRTSDGELAYAGMGSMNSMVQASFDGAMIIGDSAEGLRKAATALRVIRVYDERTNG